MVCMMQASSLSALGVYILAHMYNYKVLRLQSLHLDYNVLLSISRVHESPAGPCVI